MIQRGMEWDRQRQPESKAHFILEATLTRVLLPYDGARGCKPESRAS